MRQIAYKKGYKYQIVTDYSVYIGILNHSFATEFFSLDERGMLRIKKGYSFDGPSGLAIDTRNFMRASLAHDCLYQALRMELLEPKYRENADDLMRRICLEDGMSRIRAWWCWKAVRGAAGFAADPKNIKQIRYAP